MNKRLCFGVVSAAFLLCTFSVEAADAGAPTLGSFDGPAVLVNPELILEMNGGSLSGPSLDFSVWDHFDFSEPFLFAGPFLDGSVWEDFALHLRLRPIPTVFPKQGLVLDIYSFPIFSAVADPGPGVRMDKNGRCFVEDHFSTRSGQFNFNVGYQF
jgi:hypothetical protein